MTVLEIAGITIPFVKTAFSQSTEYTEQEKRKLDRIFNCEHHVLSEKVQLLITAGEQQDLPLVKDICYFNIQGEKSIAPQDVDRCVFLDL